MKSIKPKIAPNIMGTNIISQFKSLYSNTGLKERKYERDFLAISHFKQALSTKLKEVSPIIEDNKIKKCNFKMRHILLHLSNK